MDPLTLPITYHTLPLMEMLDCKEASSSCPPAPVVLHNTPSFWDVPQSKIYAYDTVQKIIQGEQTNPTPIIHQTTDDSNNIQAIEIVPKFSVEDNQKLCAGNIANDIIDLFSSLDKTQPQENCCDHFKNAHEERWTSQVDQHHDNDPSLTQDKSMLTMFPYTESRNTTTRTPIPKLQQVGETRIDISSSSTNTSICSSTSTTTSTTEIDTTMMSTAAKGNTEEPHHHPTLGNDKPLLSSSLGNKQIEKWQMRFEQLIDFKRIHGHCIVPNRFPQNPKLAQWVKRQRYQHKLKMAGKTCSTLTDERQQSLEEVGFVWDSHESCWTERWEELHEFRRQFGHSNVPSSYPPNRKLSIWVKCQRRQYKLYRLGTSPSNMTPDRIQKMDSLDFDWNPRKL